MFEDLVSMFGKMVQRLIEPGASSPTLVLIVCKIQDTLTACRRVLKYIFNKPIFFPTPRTLNPYQPVNSKPLAQ
jgi:hypothetical protein